MSLHFVRESWEVIRDAGDATLKKYASNVDRYVANAMVRYVNHSDMNAFRIDIDDHAIDE